MEFTIGKEQKEYIQDIINFSEKNLNDVEDTNKFSQKLWEKVAKFGLLGLTISEEYGGFDESFLTAAMAIEALGYSSINNGFIFVINNHIWVAQNLIYLYGTDLLKKKYISKMVNGELIGAFALSEAEAGSDALNMSTKAVEDGDYYILNGNKMFISNGPIADIFIVIAKTQDNPKKFTSFVVEKKYEGVFIGKEIEKMGLDACPTSEVILKNCRVPKENILGYINCGNQLMMSALEWERCYEFAPHVGAMQRIKEKCIEHVNIRRQFNKPLSEYQAITHKIANMSVAIELSKLMLYKIAWLKDNGKSAFLESSIFKLFVSENYIKTCQDALQIFGGYGYSKEYGIEKELRDALGSTIYSGTSEIQRNTIFNMTTISSFF